MPSKSIYQRRSRQGLVHGGGADGRTGVVSKDDRVLQLKGGDVITVDYPEEFKKEFKFHMMGTNEIKDVTSDAVFDAASSPVIEEGDANETFTEKLLSEEKAEDEEELSSEGRPSNEIKHSNYVYLRVPFDRDLTDQADRALVKLDGTSGDSVTVELEETGPSTGIFLGRAPDQENPPAGALASGASIESSPLTVASTRTPVRPGSASRTAPRPSG